MKTEFRKYKIIGEICIPDDNYYNNRERRLTDLEENDMARIIGAIRGAVVQGIQNGSIANIELTPLKDRGIALSTEPPQSVSPQA